MAVLHSSPESRVSGCMLPWDEISGEGRGDICLREAHWEAIYPSSHRRSLMFSMCLWDYLVDRSRRSSTTKPFAILRDYTRHITPAVLKPLAISDVCFIRSLQHRGVCRSTKHDKAEMAKACGPATRCSALGYGHPHTHDRLQAGLHRQEHWWRSVDLFNFRARPVEVLDLFIFRFLLFSSMTLRI